jgi:hypothetical protein
MSTHQHPLETIARDLLRAEGFLVEQVALEEPSRIVTAAEDPLSVIGLLAADSWSEVGSVFDDLAVGFANWVSARSPGPKRWDIYFVALIQQPLASDKELNSAEDSTYNMNAVRRLVRAGVLPEEEAVRGALAPFLPLAIVPSRPLGDPLDDLIASLRLNGVTAAVAEGAVTAFRTQGEVQL